MKQKISGMLLLAITVASVLGSAPIGLASGEEVVTEEFKDLSWTVSHSSGYINQLLTEKMLKGCKPTSGAFNGSGLNDTSIIDEKSAPVDANLVAITALLTRSATSGDTWASANAMDAWGGIKTVTTSLADGTDYYAMGFALEFLSTIYQRTEDADVKTAIVSLATTLNARISQRGYNAFWGLNVSLIVAAGLCHADQTGVVEPVDGIHVSVQNAERLIFYVDSKYWDGKFYFNSTTSSDYWLEDQALAMLSLARAYKSTGKAAYIDRAKLLIDEIDKYFFIGGMGGAIQSYGSDTSQLLSKNLAVFEGRSNALLAYACAEMYETSGVPLFADTSKVVMNFMYNRLRFSSSDKTVDGFVEYCQNTPGKNAYVPEEYKIYGPHRRLILTNALGVYVNEKITQFTHTFWQKHMWAFIWGAVIAAAIIIPIVLILRRRNRGVKIPKVVKGLIGD
ncbi:MAG: hypothetical protein ACTSU5_01515 [Promethearchaeota archaeon]